MKIEVDLESFEQLEEFLDESLKLATDNLRIRAAHYSPHDLKAAQFNMENMTTDLTMISYLTGMISMAGVVKRKYGIEDAKKEVKRKLELIRGGDE